VNFHYRLLRNPLSKHNQMPNTDVINWNGKTYEFDAKAAYDQDNIVKLPDGTLILIESWKSVIPLKIAKFRVLYPVKAVEQ